MNNETITRAKEIIELQAERTSLRTMADYVKDYIIAYCDEDPGFVECVNNAEKSFMDCIGYIKKKALEWLKEQQNIELTGYAQGIGGDVPPDICYQWAVEYYYSKPEPKPEPKKVESTSSTKTKAGKKNAAKSNSKEETTNAQMSLMESMAKQAEPITLFDNMDNVKSSDETDSDELDCESDDETDEESPDEDENELNSIWGSVEELTEEEIAELPFGKEVA